MRNLVAMAVIALALCWTAAAQELPAAPSAAQQQAQQNAFREQMDVPPNLSHQLTAGDKFQIFAQDPISPFTFSAAAASAGMASANGGARGLQRQDAAAAKQQTGGFVAKVLSSVLGTEGPGSPGSGKQTLGARLRGALAQMADVDDGPDVPQANYSQFLGMAVSDTIANAYTPLDGHGMRHARGGFSAHLGSDTGIVRGFFPGVKRFFAGQKGLKRQRDAMTWRTGAMGQQPSSVH